MNCGDVQKLLNPYIDGELDLVRHVQLEEHLAKCEACAPQEKQLRALRTAIASPALYYSASTELRQRIQSVSYSTTRGWRRPSMQWAAIAASVLVLMGLSAAGGMLLSQREEPRGDLLAESVVAAHLRSLQADHLTDVASTDRHSVKPWLSGKVDFSPDVPDLSAQGFDLLGGRLDYLSDHPAAALVYRYHLHTINVFVWPSTVEEMKDVQQPTRQGFHIRSWQKSGMRYWAISDLSDEGLNEFVRLFQEKS